MDYPLSFSVVSIDYDKEAKASNSYCFITRSSILILTKKTLLVAIY
jgi:hypothetical protein